MDTVAQRVIDFFNAVDDKYEIRYRIKSDPNFGHPPESGYGIDLSVAQAILDDRPPLPPVGPGFTVVQEIDDVKGVGPVTLHNILYSFSESWLTWTASTDGERVGTLRDVGVGTLAPEARLEIYDGMLTVKSYREQPEQVGEVKTQGAAYDVFVRGGHAFLADSGRFTVLDVSNPAAPAVVHDAIAMGDAQAVFLSRNHAYVADGSQGLQIIDVTDPANPVLRPVVDTPGIALGVHVHGDYAYVADGSKGLQIVDVTVPAAAVLQPARNYDTAGTAQGVYVAGNYAFVADGSDGLLVLDVSDLAGPPTLVTSMNTGGDARAVFVHGDLAFLADGPKGLQVIDIADPTNLQRIGNFDVSGEQAEDVFVAGSHAYVAYGKGGFRAVDISDPTDPRQMDAFAAYNDDVQGMFVTGEHAYVADRNRGLSIYHMLTTTTVGADAELGGDLTVGADANLGGYLTKQEVAFTVSNPGYDNIHRSSGTGFTKVVYGQVVTNEGGAWDRGSSRFVAPTDGVYFFSVSFVRDAAGGYAADEDVYLWILINGGSPHRAYAWAGQGSGPRNETSHSEVQRLREGDIVETFVSSDAGAPRQLQHCVFTGFRL